MFIVYFLECFHSSMQFFFTETTHTPVFLHLNRWITETLSLLLSFILKIFKKDINFWLTLMCLGRILSSWESLDETSLVSTNWMHVWLPSAFFFYINVYLLKANKQCSAHAIHIYATCLFLALIASPLCVSHMNFMHYPLLMPLKNHV